MTRDAARSWDLSVGSSILIGPLLVLLLDPLVKSMGFSSLQGNLTSTRSSSVGAGASKKMRRRK
uniref:Uncharacterized protein n=1 Tax=Arundo donax TaxID=35708 RepID=A0A0A9B350_ARUDO